MCCRNTLAPSSFNVNIVKFSKCTHLLTWQILLQLTLSHLSVCKDVILVWGWSLQLGAYCELQSRGEVKSLQLASLFRWVQLPRCNSPSSCLFAVTHKCHSCKLPTFINTFGPTAHNQAIVPSFSGLVCHTVLCYCSITVCFSSVPKKPRRTWSEWPACLWGKGVGSKRGRSTLQ